MARSWTRRETRDPWQRGAVGRLLKSHWPLLCVMQTSHPNNPPRHWPPQRPAHAPKLCTQSLPTRARRPALTEGAGEGELDILAVGEERHAQRGIQQLRLCGRALKN